jgi:hypothetical protein
MLEHRGYRGTITAIDERQRLIRGRVEGLTADVAFEGQTVEELAKAFRESVDGYLAQCAARGAEPEKPGTTSPHPIIRSLEGALGQAQGVTPEERLLDLLRRGIIDEQGNVLRPTPD